MNTTLPNQSEYRSPSRLRIFSRINSGNSYCQLSSLQPAVTSQQTSHDLTSEIEAVTVLIRARDQLDQVCTREIGPYSRHYTNMPVDFLRELALPTIRHRTYDTSVEPFAGETHLLSPPTRGPATLKKSRSRRINIAVHPFSDYTPRNALQSQGSSTALIVRPFTDDRPPDDESYLTPTTAFKIGKLTTHGPLVSATELKGHISLLGAFSELKKTVEASDITPFLRTPSQSLQDAKWTWFVGLAVERFDVWCRALKSDFIVEGDEKCLPPIDVLMVWHAYMLNPRWYTEDTMRTAACKRLKMLELNFSSLLENPAILDKPPSDARMEHWRSLTSMPFDSVKGMYIHTTRLLRCPNCQIENEVELGTQQGIGYLQSDFKATCLNEECGARDITKETLAHRKLAWDIAIHVPTQSENPGSRLAGSVFPRSSGTKVAAEIKNQILATAKTHQVISTAFDGADAKSTKQTDQQARCKAVMRHHQNMASLKDEISRQSEDTIIKRIFSAYNQDKIYSIDLVEAVLNQTKFIKQVSDLGWTRPDTNYFDDFGSESSLHHAIVRYHAFLDLEKGSPNIGCIPTLDIDLVWHTHQLMPTKYYTDMNLYLGRFLDHDAMDASTFSSSFVHTSNTWQAKFNAPYTQCGCAAPDNSIGKRLSRLVSIKPKKEAWPAVVPHTISATHPSDHNVDHSEQS